MQSGQVEISEGEWMSQLLEELRHLPSTCIETSLYWPLLILYSTPISIYFLSFRMWKLICCFGIGELEDWKVSRCITYEYL